MIDYIAFIVETNLGTGKKVYIPNYSIINMVGILFKDNKNIGFKYHFKTQDLKWQKITK